MSIHRPRRTSVPRSAFSGFRFPPDVIVVAVRWYLRFSLSYRDVEELLTDRGVEVDHVTIYRWVQRFTPMLADAARPCRHAVGDQWQVDETYIKIGGAWRYVYRAIDQFGQVVDVFVSPRRDAMSARRFFERAIGSTCVHPVEVVTDRAPAYLGVLEELLPVVWHRTDQYANNRVEADHGRLKARLRPMRASSRTAAPEFYSAGTPSCRTFGAVTMNWRLTSLRVDGWRSRSASSPWRSEPGEGRDITVPAWLNATAPSSRNCVAGVGSYRPAGDGAGSTCRAPSPSNSNGLLSRALSRAP